ncbi:Ail/Lom family outer membrane beta-barrel protein [Erwinia sorbitola]|uniref:Ail/Lom family outer membrane beta-barrel protein n=1 Tax=Erwinia sorbitola TaxID=2681984 RepID=A0A6I6EJ87_9GAMM|nr:Ail/Lom family outer membrane beta-barrel protein [Erwinia sorbitola]MTD27070.1 Ail/Lom family outer membrane beta-barrel protein [Erwinia sorbitola]QGU88628.1 Ail/Lom family outer membrane beta-barrel protein [Erwinia sorbitola]
MKKLTTILTVLTAVASAGEAVAGENSVPSEYQYQTAGITGQHTFTLGYAQSHIKHFKNIKGINLKYHYEIPELPLSAVVSLTWMNGRGSQSHDFGDSSVDKNHRVRYYSLMVGPAYRVASWASMYVLMGAGVESSYNKNNYHNASGDHSARYKIFDARFAWGAGMQFNVTNNVILDVGYQGGHVLKTSSNGFNVGVGYQF